MEIGMLKRRLNPFLLGTLLLSLAILAGLSVVYQDELSAALSRNDRLQQDLAQTRAQVAELERKQENLSAQLQAREQDLDRYVERTERLSSRVASLEDTVAEKEEVIDQQSQQLQDLRADLEAKNETVQNLEARVADMEDALTFICTDDSTNLSAAADDECDPWQ